MIQQMYNELQTEKGYRPKPAKMYTVYCITHWSKFRKRVLSVTIFSQLSRCRALEKKR